MTNQTAVVHSLVTDRYDAVPVVASDNRTVTLQFERWQFPGETYAIVFDRLTGKPLDERLEKTIELVKPEQSTMF